MEGLGGQQRVTGTLLLFVDDGALKAMLNDRDSGYIAFLSSHTAKTLLEAVEEGLRDGGLDWRESKGKKR